MKVVIDTSVWISALIKKESKAREILRLVFVGKISPQLSDALYKEYESVMKRKKIQDLVPLSIESQEELFNAYCAVAKFNNIYYTWRPNLKDEDDNFVIELAVSSSSEVILTYNEKDFKDSELEFSFKVMTPNKFLEEYRL